MFLLPRISHEEHQTEWKNNTILINYTLIFSSSELQTVIVQIKRKAFDVLHQRRARAAQELRYSALEVEYTTSSG